MRLYKIHEAAVLQMAPCLPDGARDREQEESPDVAADLLGRVEEPPADRLPAALEMEEEEADEDRLLLGHRCGREVDLALEDPAEGRVGEELRPEDPVVLGKCQQVSHPARALLPAQRDDRDDKAGRDQDALQ